MIEEQADGHRQGDKVRLRSGELRGARGRIEQVAAAGNVSVRLNTGALVEVVLDELTNTSLAARRSWQTKPKQAGRPPSGKPVKKMVSLRLSMDLWQRLGRAKERGLVKNREAAVAEWVEKGLDALGA